MVYINILNFLCELSFKWDQKRGTQLFQQIYENFKSQIIQNNPASQFFCGITINPYIYGVQRLPVF